MFKKEMDRGYLESSIWLCATAVGLVASGWSGPAGKMCSWVAHGSCPPRCREL